MAYMHDLICHTALLPFLIGGGVALPGALAGMALHASNDDQEQDERRKASSKDLS